MPHLNNDQLQQFKQQLQSREATLQNEVRTVRADQEDNPAAVGREQVDDSGEVGEERIRGAVRYAELERDIDELRDIEAALDRIADGSYGDCTDCGQPIAPARLQAQPAARRCIACQTVWERTHPPVPHFSMTP
jgi:RNA polymerase-binding protein DksA